jgi:hypothetical protein
LGAASIWSGIDTQKKHEAFTGAPSAATQSDGKSAQLRTNLLLLGTVVAAGTTAGLGIFAVGWSSGPSAVMTVGGRF